MLVLTRKLQQQIKIGEGITVTILRVKGNTVRIGVDAPREVRVLRGELPKLGESAQTGGEGVMADGDASTFEPPAPISAAHLPLRRISSRYGAAPLKQIVAACVVSAK